LPTYEYECTRCQHVFEEFRPITAPRRQRCPRCRGKVEQLVSGGAGIVFRGSGFYATDSRKSPRPAADKKTDGAQPSGASGATGSESSGSSAKDSPPAGDKGAAGKDT
jgi:putative FmdB family regulatory protein